MEWILTDSISSSRRVITWRSAANFPGTFMFTYADHIKKLVGIRLTYKDALIYGAQINQPSSSSSAVVAYQYLGTLQRIVIIVSIVDELIEPTITDRVSTRPTLAAHGLTWSLGAPIRRITASLRTSAWESG